MEGITLSEVEYVSMARLLFERGASVGSLATAIESSGVWGWDRYGRFKLFGPEHRASLDALDRLALHYEKINDPQDEEYGVHQDPETDRLYLFGWPADQLPSMQESERVVLKPTRPQAASRGENATLRLVEGLRRFCLGLLTDHRHPDCANEDELIAAIVNHSAGRDGLKKATIKSKFKAAFELWDIA